MDERKYGRFSMNGVDGGPIFIGDMNTYLQIREQHDGEIKIGGCFSCPRYPRGS